MLLADLGADVLKIEHPDGDETRRWGPPFVGDTAAYYLAINRNKRSVTGDLSDAVDNAMVRELASVSDVIIENFRPGALKRFNLDYATVRTSNPLVVYCTITGFGSDGPESARPGFDLVVQAMGGLMSITGEASGDPVKVGIASADLLAGTHATIAVLGALMERTVTGQGKAVEVSLLDTQIATLVNQAMNWLVGGIVPERMGSDHPNVVPCRAFPTATGHMVVVVGTDKQFRALCDVVGRPELARDERFSTNVARVANRDRLVADLSEIFWQRDRAEWLVALESADVPCGPVRNIDEVFNDPIVADRMVRHIDGVYGNVPQVVSPFRLDGKYPAVDLPPPILGEHNDQFRQSALSEAADELAPTGGD